jgi:hypothetical protein
LSWVSAAAAPFLALSKLPKQKKYLFSFQFTKKNWLKKFELDEWKTIIFC